MSGLRGILAVVVLLTATPTACGTTSGNNGAAAMTSTESSDPEATLRTRLSFEEAQQQARAAAQDWATQDLLDGTGLTVECEGGQLGRLQR